MARAMPSMDGINLGYSSFPGSARQNLISTQQKDNETASKQQQNNLFILFSVGTDF
jgi:hypothetical protein